MHSFLITHWWVQWVSNAAGNKFSWYRLCYNIFSIVTLVPVIWLQFRLPHEEILILSGWPRIVQVLLYGYALYMFLVGKKRYDMRFFFGLKQIEEYQEGRKKQPLSFSADKTGGVRHPWYSAGIALVLAFGPYTDVTLAAKSVLVCYFIVGAKLEERKLLREFGTPYAEYCKKVPMLIPRLLKIF